MNALLPRRLPQTAAAPLLGSLRFRSGRSRRGVYDGVDKKFGNNVSFSKRRTRRSFSPNVFTKSLYSETLDELIRLNVSAKALRSIDKAGGLDNYLAKSKHVVEGSGKRVLGRIQHRKELDAKFGRENVVWSKENVKQQGFGTPGFYKKPW